MDAKDRTLLLELSKNARLPIQQIARKVKVSREVAAYRIKRLSEEEIIREFYTLIDTSTLGYSRYGFLLQLKGISIEEERKFFSWIAQHDYLSYAGTTVGRWNVALDIFAKDRDHLKSVIYEIINQIRSYFDSYVVVPIHSYESFPTKLLGGTSSIQEPTSQSPINLDAIDKKILFLLSKNARIEYKELAPKLRLTANAVKYRILRLQREQVIRGYSVSLNTQKLNLEFYNLQLKYLGVHEKHLLDFLRKADFVSYFYQHLENENWNYDIGLIVKNSQELRDFLIHLRREINDGIKIHDVYPIGEMIKSDYVPQGVFS